MKTLLALLGVLLLMPSLLQAQSGDGKAQALVDQALADFRENKYDAAIPKLVEADKLVPNSTFILNLLGAAYTKKKDYAKADEVFRKALDVDYSFFPAAFNLGELLFLQKHFPQALDYFARLLRDNPGNELLQFKVVLCLLQTEQLEEAKKLAARIRVPGQEPSWYFANAAIALKEGRKGEAKKYVSTGKALFADRSQLYEETFQDLGWPTK